jgi:hypothetical protein
MALTTSMIGTSLCIPDRSEAGQNRESFRGASWASHGLSSKESCPRRWLGAIESWILWRCFVRILSGTVACTDYCQFIAFGGSA